MPEVFYPAVPIPSDEGLKKAQRSWQSVLRPEAAAFMQGKRVFVSINRFERKKVHTFCISLQTCDWQQTAMRSGSTPPERVKAHT